jgi:cytochrome c-type biogenesis protein CcmH/NrfG
LPEPPEPSRAAGAAAALLEQSRGERSSGELDRAAATLERGLTLAPDDPALWVELAEVRLAQGNAALAQETARKALTLTGDDYALESRARRLIGR